MCSETSTVGSGLLCHRQRKKEALRVNGTDVRCIFGVLGFEVKALAVGTGCVNGRGGKGGPMAGRCLQDSKPTSLGRWQNLV